MQGRVVHTGGVAVSSTAGLSSVLHIESTYIGYLGPHLKNRGAAEVADGILEGREERSGDRGVEQRRQGAAHAALPGDGQQQGLSHALQPALSAYLRCAMGPLPCTVTAAASGVALRGQLWEVPLTAGHHGCCCRHGYC